MNWIEIDGVALRYELCGSGTGTLVFVHEMGGTLESWDLVLPLIKTSRTMMRYDMRGAGQSTKLRGTASFDAMADDIVSLLGATGQNGPAVVVGCAVGGAVSLHAAARHPRRIEAVIAFGPATGIAEERRSLILAHAANVEQNGMHAVAENELALSYPEVLRGDAERFRRFRARWLANDPGSYAAIYRMLAGIEMHAELASLPVPALFVAGHKDPLRPPAMIEPIARTVPNARFEAIDSGHFSATQTPDIVADTINTFLAGLDGNRPYAAVSKP